MKMFRHILIFITAMAMMMPGLAQLSKPGTPYPLHYPGAAEIPYIYIAPEKKMIAAGNSSISDTFRLKNATGGELINVSYDPMHSGIWDTLFDGSMLWRAGFEIKDALVTNIIFSPWKLNPGVKVFLYDPGQKHVRGAFTELNNKFTGILATASVPGSRIIIEMHVPPGSSYGSLAISGIGCDFSGPADLLKDGWFGESGTCNTDIFCLSDPVAGTVKKSVVRIVYNGHERCTGTLINSAQVNKISYILTAGHCFTKEASANSAVFYFEYESPSCNGTDGDDSKSLSGATIRARSSDVDFALLELFEPIPASYHPYYAGWNNSGLPPQSGFTIHHPLGDVKKIAEEDDPVLISSFGRLYDPHTHFLIDRWESGTTEPGSSGAPFFDHNGFLMGTLTGGLASCDDPSTDYFQMFSHSWRDYPEIDKQLAAWLDPMNLKMTVLAGYDPSEDTTRSPSEYDVMVFPNPASLVLHIRFSELITVPVRVSMFNIQGQMVFDESYPAYQHSIPVYLQGIADGIYVIRVRKDNHDSHLKIAVLK